jgi:hypothetical protein
VKPQTYYDLFLFVPGKEWLWTSVAADDLAEAKCKAAEFAAKYAGAWSQLRIYPAGSCAATAIRGEVVWQ